MRRALSFAFATLLALAAAACTGGGSDPNAFTWTSASGAGGTLHVRDGVGTVTIRRSADHLAHVTGGVSWKGRRQDVRFATTNVGGDVYICAMWSDSGQCGASGYHGVNGFHLLSLLSLFHHGDATQAQFTIELPDSVSLDVSDMNGAIVMAGVFSPVAARVTSGVITATDVAGPLAVRVTNGAVRLSLRPGANTDSLNVQITNGGIHAALPADVQGAFDLSTTNGAVKVASLALTPDRRGRQYTGQLGASTRPVNMHVVNGAVSITTVAAR